MLNDLRLPVAARTQLKFAVIVDATGFIRGPAAAIFCHSARSPDERSDIRELPRDLIPHIASLMRATALRIAEFMNIINQIGRPL